MRTRTSVIILCALAFTVRPVLADDALDRLRQATTIRCLFDLGTQAQWKGGELALSPNPVHFGEGGTVTFDSISRLKPTADPEAPLSALMLGKARIIANVGASSVVVMFSGLSLSFIESTIGGSVNVTTIFGQHQKPELLDYLAVTSRHIAGFGDLSQPSPSQYYGTCRVIQ